MAAKQATSTIPIVLAPPSGDAVATGLIASLAHPGDPDDFPVAFSSMTRRRPDAMFLVADAFTSMHRKRLIEFAATHRIPAMYEFSFLVRDGGLMSYGPSPEDGFRRAALYIDRIFKGAKPADLPAEQPTRYYFTVNLKTAATLGLTIPPSLLLRADDVIQ